MPTCGREYRRHADLAGRRHTFGFRDQHIRDRDERAPQSSSSSLPLMLPPSDLRRLRDEVFHAAQRDRADCAGGVKARRGDEDAAVVDEEVRHIVRPTPLVDHRLRFGLMPMRAVPIRCQPQSRISGVMDISAAPAATIASFARAR